MSKTCWGKCWWGVVRVTVPRWRAIGTINSSWSSVSLIGTTSIGKHFTVASSNDFRTNVVVAMATLVAEFVCKSNQICIVQQEAIFQATLRTVKLFCFPTCEKEAFGIFAKASSKEFQELAVCIADHQQGNSAQQWGCTKEHDDDNDDDGDDEIQTLCSKTNPLNF